MKIMEYEIGTKVALNTSCYCGECDCGNEYVICIIEGNEDDDFLSRCCIFDDETMKRLE
jgi:hypothetical protein